MIAVQPLHRVLQSRKASRGRRRILSACSSQLAGRILILDGNQ